MYTAVVYLLCLSSTLSCSLINGNHLSLLFLLFISLFLFLSPASFAWYSSLLHSFPSSSSSLPPLHVHVTVTSFKVRVKETWDGDDLTMTCESLVVVTTFFSSFTRIDWTTWKCISVFSSLLTSCLFLRDFFWISSCLSLFVSVLFVSVSIIVFVPVSSFFASQGKIYTRERRCPLTTNTSGKECLPFYSKSKENDREKSEMISQFLSCSVFSLSLCLVNQYCNPVWGVE